MITIIRKTVSAWYWWLQPQTTHTTKKNHGKVDQL